MCRHEQPSALLCCEEHIKQCSHVTNRQHSSPFRKPSDGGGRGVYYSIVPPDMLRSTRARCVIVSRDNCETNAKTSNCFARQLAYLGPEDLRFIDFLHCPTTLGCSCRQTIAISRLGVFSAGLLFDVVGQRLGTFWGCWSEEQCCVSRNIRVLGKKLLTNTVPALIGP